MELFQEPSSSRRADSKRGAGFSLRAIGAFECFVEGKHGYSRSGADNVPDELALGGLDRRSAVTLAAGAARPLGCGGVGIKDDTIPDAFRNYAHVVFDGDAQRPASAPDD